MADPTSKSQIDTFRRPQLPGVREPTSQDIAELWLILEQINILRAAASLPAISKATARNEIMRLRDVIHNLPEGS